MERLFRNAIVRLPCPEMIHGLTFSNLGTPDYQKALEQHSKYIEGLKICGLSIKILDPYNSFPDSTFIEDTAVCTTKCAVITNPGAVTRKGEISGMRSVLQEFYDNIEEIVAPGTLDAGDAMMVADHFFVGISVRTNHQGANQLMEILQGYGYSCSTIFLTKMLHLKSGAAYLEHGNMLVSGELIDQKEFAKFNRIIVAEDENYASNSLWLNGKVLIPEGFPKTRNQIENAGYETITLGVSEFRKLDGGLSCLSLRF